MAKLIQAKNIDSLKEKIIEIIQSQIGDSADFSAMQTQLEDINQRLDTFGLTKEQTTTIQSILAALGDAEESEQIQSILDSLINKANTSDLNEVATRVTTLENTTSALDGITDKVNNNTSAIETINLALAQAINVEDITV